jgi:carboxyl-terminal processing protease
LRTIVPLIVVSILWGAIGWFANTLITGPAMSLTPEQELVAKAQLVLQQHYLPVEPLSDSNAITQTLADAAISGMLEWGGDRFADLYGPIATQRFLAGYTENIGITNLNFDLKERQLVITGVPADGPAAAAGVQVGDILLGTNEMAFGPYTGGYEASILLRGPAESTYELIVRRGEEILTLPVTRQRWNYLRDNVIAQDIGYFTTDTFFNEHTADDVKALLEKFQQSQVRAIIWDLRGSAGGATDPVQTITGYFHRQGDLLFSAEFKNGVQRQFLAESNGIFPDLPVAVLIDRGTLSASEIAAAAMALRPRTQLFGENTAGKGTIQSTVMLDENHSLHFTIAKWLAPDGAWMDKTGVPPDVALVDDPTTAEDEVLAAAIAYLRSQ